MTALRPFVTKLNNGLTIPNLAFGVGTALYKKAVSDAVKLAIDVGFVHLDGAQVYGNEDSLGDGIIASGVSRSELYVTTKLNKIPNNVTIRQTLEESLKKLKLDYVDLFLVHFPAVISDSPVEHWKEIEELQKDGLTKSIGVSNFTVADLQKILPTAKVYPAVNQIEYHPFQYSANTELFKLQKQYGIVTSSYGGLSPLFRSGGSKDLAPVLKAISERLTKDRGSEVNTGHVLQKWLLQRQIVVITTSSKEERLKEYLDVVNVPDLTDSELSEIDKVGAANPHKYF